MNQVRALPKEKCPRFRERNELKHVGIGLNRSANDNPHCVTFPLVNHMISVLIPIVAFL